MRREEQTRDALPVSRNGERALPASRRIEHRPEDGGRNRAYPAGRHEARELLEADQSGTGAVSGTLAGLPGNAGGLMQATAQGRTPVGLSVGLQFRNPSEECRNTTRTYSQPIAEIKCQNAINLIVVDRRPSIKWSTLSERFFANSYSFANSCADVSSLPNTFKIVIFEVVNTVVWIEIIIEIRIVSNVPCNAP